MIPVELITEEELTKRFDILPEGLRQALLSDRNLTIVDQVCDKNRIADVDKRDSIRQLVAFVMLGVIHYYDIGGEIDEALGLNNPKFSNAVADELNVKIFNPIKNELEGNYQPLITPIQDVKIQDSAPKPMVPISSKSVAQGPTTPPPAMMSENAPVPKIYSQTVPGQASFSAKPLASNEKKAAPAPAAPKADLSNVGWSKITPQDPVVKLSQTSGAPPQAPSSTPRPIQIQAKPGVGLEKSAMGEFERLSNQNPAVKPGGPATPPPAAPEPAPVMMHEDATFKPQKMASDFHLQETPKNFDMTKDKGTPQPVKPAVLEFGGTTPPQQAPKPTATPRAVHYSEYLATKGPATPPAPAAPQGPRQITELTSPEVPPPPAAPKPPTSPTPPAPPAPPVPSAQPKTMPPVPPAAPKPPTPPTKPAGEPKVIHKDYTSPATPETPPRPPQAPPQN